MVRDTEGGLLVDECEVFPFRTGGQWGFYLLRRPAVFIPWPVPLLLRSLINQYLGMEWSLSLRFNHRRHHKKFLA